MDQLTTLVAKAQSLLDNPAATMQQLNEVYYICTGTNCRQERKIRFLLNSLVQNPSRYQLRIQQYFDTQKMANQEKKYRFSPQGAGVTITVHDDAGRAINITAQTLTDERAELLLRKYPNFAHNIERIPGTEEKAPEPEPVVEEPVQEIEPVQETEAVAEAEPAPVVEEAPAPEPAPRKKKRRK